MRDTFIAGSKLLGIYFLYHALTTLPPTIGMVLATLSAGSSSYQVLPILSLLAGIFSGLVMIAFAFALLFKTELIASKLNISGVCQPSAQKGDKLEPGIILIGIYIFCTKVGWLAEVFAKNQWANKIRNPFAATQPQGLSFSSDYIAPCVTLIAALLLIFGAKHITAFLTKEKHTETEQANQPDAE
jgi:hypothetical protein